MNTITEFLQENIQIEYTLRIILAMFFGALVGYERKSRLKEAGVRTHMIVCLGSCLLMLVSKYGFVDIANRAGYRVDPGRIASQIVTGIGFLGAGMIFVRKQTVSGLTTAAGIWASAAIGMAIGCGMYFLGIFSTLMLIFIQALMHDHAALFRIPVGETIEIQMKNQPASLRDLQAQLKKREIEVINVKVDKLNETVLAADLLVKFPPDFSPDELLILFNDLDYILSLEF